MDAHLAGLQAVVQRSCGAQPLPDAVREKAKLMLLDTLGCILAGRLAPELVELEAAFARIESGPFRFPGGAPLSTQAATAVAAIASTWDEGCEGLAYAHGRPALPIVGALLALAVLRKSKLEDTLKSLVAGYEVGARAGGWLRIRPGMHVDGNWPGLGVAAAVSRLLGVSAEATLTAINIAACQLPASLYLPIKTGDNARNTYIAHSAWLGLIAAFSADAGITAPSDALLHYAKGFAVADPEVPDVEHWFLLDAYFKLHASVRHAHYGIEAARRIRDQLGGDTRSISAIRLTTYPEAVTYAGNRAPRVPIQAQFSVSFGVAAGLRFGGMEADIYRAPKFEDVELRRLEGLVDLRTHETNGRSADLTVIAGGKNHEARCDRVAGDAGMPISREEIVAKFLRYSKGAVPEPKAAAFAAALMEEKHAGFDSVWAHLL
jgi:2-methylcitrate dehydratase PrpD